MTSVTSGIKELIKKLMKVLRIQRPRSSRNKEERNRRQYKTKIIIMIIIKIITEQLKNGEMLEERKSMCEEQERGRCKCKRLKKKGGKLENEGKEEKN